jgi:signal transduction histidine kinase
MIAPAPKQTTPNRWNSLRLRFMIAVLLWVALGITAILWSSVRLFTQHLEQNYHEELEVHVKELAQLAQFDTDGRVTLNRPLSDPRYAIPSSGFYWQIRVNANPPLKSKSMTTGELDDQIAHAPEILHRLTDGPTGPTIAYGFTRELPTVGLVHYTIATDQRHLDRIIGGFMRELSLWLAVLGLLLLASGMAVVAFGLKPLDRLSQGVARLRRGEVAALDGDYPNEIAPLVVDLNAYVNDNARHIERARVLAGNLAHSLRTPLAVITDEAEQLQDAPATQTSGVALLAQAAAIGAQVDFHLARARLIAQVGTASGHGAMMPNVFEPILRAMRRLYPDQHFTLTYFPKESVRLPVDPVQLSELLSNLIDNAAKWAEREVIIRVSRTPAHMMIAIKDDGPGMTPAQIEQCFAIGTRFSTDKPGAGLGLAIAKELASAMDMALELKPRKDTSGLCASLIANLGD